MMPPTSIDGTDITGATIDGTDVQEITVDGDTVFSAGPTIIEDFERANPLNDYQGNVGNWQTTTSQAIDGTSLQKATGNAKMIYNRSLTESFSRGETATFEFDPVNGINSFDAFVFGIQPAANENYAVVFTTSNFRIFKDLSDTGFTRTELTSGGSGFQGEASPLKGEVEWGATDITFTVFDANGVQVTQIDATDTDYSTGDVGWWGANASGTVSDMVLDNLQKP